MCVNRCLDAIAVSLKFYFDAERGYQRKLIDAPEGENVEIKEVSPVVEVDDAALHREVRIAQRERPFSRHVEPVVGRQAGVERAFVDHPSRARDAHRCRDVVDEGKAVEADGAAEG